MPLNSRPSPGEPLPAFELKAGTFTLPVLRLLIADMDAAETLLAAKVKQAPDFFHNTPVVIDLGAFQAEGGEVPFPQLVGLLRGSGMIPVGVRGGTKSQNTAAEAMELAILGEAFNRLVRPTPPPTPTATAPAGPMPREPEPEAEHQGESGFLLVTRPVRSGQRVYAAGGDLSVIAAVSAGAEVMADGNVHVYGPLRGRALAGTRGNTQARIFCQDLQAELVSVAGHYRVSENIPAELRGMPVQIFLEDKTLRIEKI